MNGTDLLAEFRENRSETAFRELVRHYTNLVFSVAKRRLWNVSLAQEATQLVFIRLANAVPNLRDEAQLAAWLHRTTVHVAIDLWRSESRRRVREDHAAAMQQSDTPENATWNEIAPALDEALNKLADADRQLILLRYFDEKPMRELGLVLGISEDAAKMRVSRAMEKLREQLGATGVTCTAIVLSTLLLDRSVEAAPASLVSTLALLKLPATLGTMAAGGMLEFLATVSKIKLAATTLGILSVGIAVALWHSTRLSAASQQLAFKQGSATNLVVEVTNQNTPVASENLTTTNEDLPSALQLLNGVVRARQRIPSGVMEFDASFSSKNFKTATNLSHFKAEFDGGKLRFEKTAHTHRIAGVGDVAETNRIKWEESAMDDDSGVKAGLLEPEDEKVVTSFDGSRILQYQESNGKPNGTCIFDQKHDLGEYLFDPRCLGLDPWFNRDNTPGTVLALTYAKSVATVAKEMIDTTPTFHVLINYGDWSRDLWIEAAHPERVIKMTCNGETMTCKFDESNPSDPIPVRYSQIWPRGDRHIYRRALKLNVSFPPSTWTLAGLNMPIGTSVSDNRISRGIGYWTGTGLSDNLPNKSETNAIPDEAPDLGSLLATLDKRPKSSEALESALWIIRNTPDGAEVEHAAEVIAKYHATSPDLVDLCQQLERLRYHCASALLQTILDRNPDKEIRANACFRLATLLKAQSGYGTNKTATTDAEKYFNRVVKQFGDVKINGRTLSSLAAPELNELHNLIIGKPAPNTQGVDFEGNRFSLTDYRGKTVLLVFWSHNCQPEFHFLRDILKDHEDQLVVVGVCVDRKNYLDQSRSVAANKEIPWRTFYDGDNGPITKAWNNDSWPNYNIVDRNGIIRQRHLWYGDITKAIEQLGE